MLRSLFLCITLAAAAASGPCAAFNIAPASGKQPTTQRAGAGEVAAQTGGIILTGAGDVVSDVNPLAGKALAAAGGLLLLLASDLKRRREVAAAANAPRAQWTDTQRAAHRRKVDTSKAPAAHAPATTPAVTPAPRAAA
jgi:hypothetical protein